MTTDKNIPEIILNQMEWAFYVAKIAEPGKIELTYVNHEIEALLGYQPDEFIDLFNNHPESLLHPADLLLVQDHLLKAADQQQKKTISYRVLHRVTQQYVIVEDKLYPVKHTLPGSEIAGRLADMTDQWHHESKMVESLRSYVELYQNAPVAHFNLDIRGNIQEFNNTMVEMLKFKGEELIRMHFDDLFDLNVKPGESNRLLKEVSRWGVLNQEETLMKDAKGSYRWINLTGKAQRDSEGILTGYRLSASDITTSKESEVNFRHLFQHAPLGILVYKEEGKIQQANSTASKIFGYDQESLEKLSINALIPEIDQYYQHSRSDIWELPNNSFISMCVPAYGSGTLLNLEISIGKIRYGKSLRFIAFINDLTDREKSRLALIQSEKRFRAITDTARGGIITITEHGTISYTNPSANVMFGYHQGQLEGVHLDELIPGFFANLMLQEGLNAHTQANGLRSEKAGIKQDGSTFPLELSYSFWDEGNIRFYSIITTDISIRKAHEAELTKNLVEKETLIKEVHHRVKNNLQIIKSLLSLQTNRVTSDESKSILYDSQNRVLAMAMIHEQLYRSKNVNEVDIGDYFDQLARSLLSNLKEDSISIDFDNRVKHKHLELGTAVPLALILNEIITNSIKHAFHGRDNGTIYADLAEGRGQTFRLSIGDNGNGLPENIDLQNTDSLGAKLIFRLAEQIDGTVNVSSENGTHYLIKFSTND